MNALSWLTTLVLLTSLPCLALPDFKSKTLVNNGSSASKIDFVFLGDGYLEKDKRLLDRQVQSVLRELWQVSPFKAFKNDINIHVVYAYSKKGKGFGKVDYLFGSEEGERNTVRVKKSNDAVRLAKRAVPGAELVILLTRKTGRAHGGGGLVVLTENGHIAISHEIGHALGRLGDEYSSETMLSDRRRLPTGRDLPYPNLTLSEYIDPSNAQTIEKTAKWGHFLKLKGAYPQISAYQGGYYRTIDVWRPSFTCIMRNSNGREFCGICHETLVKRFHQILKRPFHDQNYHRKFPLK